MKTKKKKETMEDEEFTPVFYVVAFCTIVGMAILILLFVGLVVAVTKLLMGTL